MPAEGMPIIRFVLEVLGILVSFHLFAEVLNVSEDDDRRAKYARLPGTLIAAVKKSYKTLKDYARKVLAAIFPAP